MPGPMRPTALTQRCHAATIATSVLLLAACQAPPKPPSVEDLPRRPANAQATIELQSCRTDLHNTRIANAELTRRAEVSGQALIALSARAQLLARLQEAMPAAGSPQANRLFAVPFSRGSSQLTLPHDLAAQLAESARSAPWIVLRATGDHAPNSPESQRLAAARAAALRQHLIEAGVPTARIRSTIQSDAADTGIEAESSGPAWVEIELYHQPPQRVLTEVAVRP